MAIRWASRPYAARARLPGVALLAAAIGGAGTATAQPFGDAGASAARSEPAEPPPPPPEGLKTLSPQQSLPENLPGWRELQERQRRPALAERTPLAPPELVPAAGESGEASVEAYKRRLRAYEQGGVTVLSNRREEAPAARLVRVAESAAAAVPAPAPVAAEPEPEELASVTETRSLRTNQLQARTTSDASLRWSALAVAIALVGLGWIWLRRRRAEE